MAILHGNPQGLSPTGPQPIVLDRIAENLAIDVELNFSRTIVSMSGECSISLNYSKNIVDVGD
jgi:hypothetical protein